MTDKKAIGGGLPPPTSGPSFTPQPPPQANPPPPQPYGVMPGVPTSPYMIPGQSQLYPQGPPPAAYDQAALTHPALVGQHMYPPGTMYAAAAAGYPTYLGYPTYAPTMQYYPSLGAYSYAMQPQLRPTIMIPNGYEAAAAAGARFDSLGQQVLPPGAPPGVPPSAAQLAAMAGHQVALGQKKNTFLAGAAGTDAAGGYTFW